MAVTRVLEDVDPELDGGRDQPHSCFVDSP